VEQSFQLDAKENAALAQLEQDRTQALAGIGALMLDLEQGRKNLEGAVERQKAFIRTALAVRNVEGYENARLINGSLVVTMPNAPLEMMPAAPPPNGPNGALAIEHRKE
jgi:hypothetical protein